MAFAERSTSGQGDDVLATGRLPSRPGSQLRSMAAEVRS